jgi:tetratricopeptide (TPR) repeat protein
MTGPIIVTAGAAILWITVSVIGCGRAQDAESPTAATDNSGPQRSSAIEAALAAAEQYLDGNDLASAETILVKLLEAGPANYRAHELYGRVLYLRGVHAQRAGRDEAGAELFAAAYDHYRASVEAAEAVEAAVAAGLNQSAGEIASAAGLSERAVAHFQAAGRLDPASPKHPLYEAQMLIQLERTAEARRALERVLELDPDEAYAYASLAAVAMAEGNRVSALRHIREARDIAPGNLGIRIQEARLRRQCDEPRQALELLMALDERLRAREAVTAEIAACHLALGNPVEAARAWEYRYRRHPRQPTAWRAAVRAGEAHLAAGRRQDAQWWCREARLVAGDRPEIEALEQALNAPPEP